jgi:hypothetical protein
MTDQLTASSDSQSRVILEMERKLNSDVFWRRLWKKDKFCSITTAKYWDWLTYIDVNRVIELILYRTTISLSGRS